MRTSGLLPVLSAVVGLLGTGAETRVSLPFPPVIQAIAAPPGGNGAEIFEQLIDHSNPSLGTFSQQYWWNSTYWKGPGSPV